MKYTIKNLRDDFPNDSACLDFLFNMRFEGKACTKCEKQYGFARIKGRKSYACNNCGTHVSPTAGTIFHKSDTDLTLWFHAIFLMSTSKNGVAAKELERQLGVTYKTAWRMARHIRMLMKNTDGDLLGGTVEVDETYVGGRQRGKAKKRFDNKTPVVGMVERGGRVRAEVVPDTRLRTLMPMVRENIDRESRLITDEHKSYWVAGRLGYQHDVINHHTKEYVRGDIYTNTIEGFWSQMKRSINGTYHSVSPKYLQHYVDEFSFRYSYRKSALPLFHLMATKASQPV